MTTPVCLTFDHVGRGKDVGLGLWVQPAPDAAEITVAIPRVLRLLDELKVKGTFYVEGWSALHHRDVIGELIASGHEIGLHGWVHERWTALTEREQERILRDGQAALQAAGAQQIGFRAPHGDVGVETLGLLSELGYHHDASRLIGAGDDLGPRRVQGVPHVPFAWALVDFWLLRKSQEHVAPEDLARRWFEEAVRCHENGHPVVVDVHPFFAALDDRIWESVREWTQLIAADGRFAWSSVGRLADSLPRGVAPTPEKPDVDWADYLRERGHEIPPGTRSTPLVGGVSATVARVGDFVVKRPLEQLAVPMPWLADTDRALAEASAMRRASAVAPRIVDLDQDAHVIVMEHVAGVTWKEQLMAGQMDAATAATAGSLLARIHTLDPAGLHDPRRFDELRLDPYLRVAARNLPQYADQLDLICDRLATGRSHLVHGDYSPKNLLVDEHRITVLDWEVAHAGDPAFDLGFLLTHLVCKAVVLPKHRGALRECAEAFMNAYISGATSAPDEEWIGQILGALILGRTDGLSPLSYLDGTHRETLRGLAGELIDKGGPLWPL